MVISFILLFFICSLILGVHEILINRHLNLFLQVLIKPYDIESIMWIRNY